LREGGDVTGAILGNPKVATLTMKFTARSKKKTLLKLFVKIGFMPELMTRI
jgi:hypothetical protein